MQNVVSLRPDRPRPQRPLGTPRGGARILFFTGVRYCRDDGASTDHRLPGLLVRVSERPLDAATH